MLKVIIYVWVLVLAVSAQAPADPIKNFCRRFGHQTAIIDRKLYIDGGWVYANPIAQNPQPVINPGLLYSDLDVVTEGMPTEHAGLEKNSTIPDVYGGILWADEVNKVFWLFGGQYSTPSPSPFQLWGYDVILNQWNLSTATGTVDRVAYGAGTSVSTLGRAFYYGGYLNNQTVPAWNGPPLATSSLITLDMDANTITNGTGPDSYARAEGVMLYVPASSAGLLIYFGGVWFPYGNDTEEPMDMSTILIYDIGDATWHTQTATGSVPPNRRKFCAGATWAEDQSSYQIYLYGGFGFGDNATGFDDVYLLTMPTFEWVKWYPDKPGTTAYPHGDLTCNVIDNSQMIVMGGNFTYMEDCDAPAVQGQHNLNLGQDDPTDAKWYQYLTNVTSYSVPSAVISIAGGSPTGGANKQAPANGFQDPALSVYFQGKASLAQRTPTRYIAPTGTPTPSPSKTNIGAIVGGVIGGVVALLIIAVCAFFCLRRRKRRRTQAGATSPPIQTGRSEMPANQHYPSEKYAKSSVVGSPGSTSNPGSPYSTPPPFGMSPHYHPAHQSNLQYYPFPSPHQHHEMSTSPPLNHYQPQYSPPLPPHPQEFFPPPEIKRKSPATASSPIPQMHEMPANKTPGGMRSPQLHHPVAMRADDISRSTGSPTVHSGGGVSSAGGYT